VEELGACTGAAGGAGVEAVAGAGVEGAFEEEATAGVALGYIGIRFIKKIERHGYTLEIMQTMKPFSSILYDSTVLASCRILPKFACEYIAHER
jgi:hypothetical protein